MSDAAKEASEAARVRAVAEACAWQGKAEQLQQRLLATPGHAAQDSRSQIAVEQERRRTVEAHFRAENRSEKKLRQSAEEELWRQRHDPCQEIMAGRAIQPLLKMKREVDETMYAAQKK